VNSADRTFNSILKDIKSRHLKIVISLVYDTDITAALMAEAYEISIAGVASGVQWIIDEYSLTSYSFEVRQKRVEGK
jgi:hypothetical protein